jgi:hypothetical protein
VAVDSQAATVRANDFKKALDWLRAAGKEVRNARLAPFAATSAEVWGRLRQESNVELGPITLAGVGPQELPSGRQTALLADPLQETRGVVAKFSLRGVVDRDHRAVETCVQPRPTSSPQPAD